MIIVIYNFRVIYVEKTLKIKNPQNSNSALAKRRRNKAGNSLSPIHRLAKNVAKLGAAPLIYINSLKT